MLLLLLLCCYCCRCYIIVHVTLDGISHWNADMPASTAINSNSNSHAMQCNAIQQRYNSYKEQTMDGLRTL